MLKTERLILRPFEETEEDLELILALYSDPEIMRFVPYDLLNREQAKAHLKRISEEWKQENPKNFEMAVILKDGMTPIGRAHYHVDEAADSAMIGGMLLKPWWNGGLAGEMALAMIDHCFEVLHLHRVVGLCHPDNIGSWKMMERCGMRREGYTRQSVRYVKNGQERWEDELIYAILKDERKYGRSVKKESKKKENIMNDCLFCKIIAGEIPSTKVYEDDKVFAFRDINPKAPVHVLIVPKKHLDSANEINEENVDDVAACLLAVPKIAAAEGVSEGYNVLNNCGAAAGQTVMHLHFHLLGGLEMDF